MVVVVVVMVVVIVVCIHKILPKVDLPTMRSRGPKSIDDNLVLVGSHLGLPPIGEHHITQPTHNPPTHKSVNRRHIK